MEERIIEQIDNIDATFEVCADKSVTIRAVLFAAFSSGRSVIHNPLMCEDTFAAIECAKTLGAKVGLINDTLYIDGAEKISDNKTFDCKRSGTVLRLLCGLLAGAEVNAVLTGDEQLKNRPIDRLLAPLTARGANITATDGKLPIYISPAKINDFFYKMPVDSAQIKSAVILCGVTGNAKTVIEEKNHTRDHTEKLLPLFGVNVFVSDVIIVEPNALSAAILEMPRDPSAAAYYLAIGLIKGRVKVNDILISKRRAGYLYKLKECGANIEFVNERYVSGELCADVIAKKSDLSFIEISEQEIPSMIDELPVIGLIGAFFNGARIKNASELKVKESDRFTSTINLIKAFGGGASRSGDDLIVKGGVTPELFTFTSDDHRMVMTAFVAMICGAGGKLIDDNGVNKSFPRFFKNFNAFRACLIGKDVSRSLSGRTHNYFIENLKAIKNYSYELLSADDKKAAEILEKSAYRSINVTIPHKELAFTKAKNLSFDAKLAKSVNFIFDGMGYTFDGDGLIYSLLLHNVNVKNKKVLICGAGGAGRSITVAMLKAGATVFISNRTKEKLIDYIKYYKNIVSKASESGGLGGSSIDKCGNFSDYGIPKEYAGERCDIVINATSLKDELPIDKQIIEQAKFVADINYGNETCLLVAAKSSGINNTDGKEMLFAQSYLADALVSEKTPNFNEFARLYKNYDESN